MKKASLFFCFVMVFLCPAAFGNEKTLTLAETLDLAFQNDPRVLRLKAAYDRVLSDVHRGKGLYDWTVQLGAGYSDADQAREVIFQPSNIKQTNYDFLLDRSFSTGSRLSIEASTIRTRDDSTFNLINNRFESRLAITVEQELLQGVLGLPGLTKLRADRERLKAVQDQLWRELELIAGDLSRRYWTLWRDKRLLEVAVANEKEAKEFYDETVRLSRTGLREKDEILQAETSWLERQEETLSSRTRMENAWSDFKSSLGFGKNPEWTPVPDLEPPPTIKNPFSVDEILDAAYLNRGDWLAAEKTVLYSEKIAKSLRWSRLPLLTASGGYSLVGLDPSFSESVDQVAESDIPGWNVGVTLKHRFGQNFDWADMIGAEANLSDARADYLEHYQAVQRDVDNAARNFFLQRRRLDINESIEKNTGQVRTAFRKKYGQGRIAIQDLLQSQENHRQARIRRQLNESALAVAEMDLQLSQGIYLNAVVGKDRRLHSLLEGFRP